jgi:molybdenum cofactor synthesis domain-containing protein
VEYHLLEKTELWISPLQMVAADLGACARAVAEVLGLAPEDIMVTDAAGDRLVFDILVPTIEAKNIISQKETLLNALARAPGVHITDNTEVHSDGILGLISLDKKNGQQLLERSRALQTQIVEHIRKRVMVFATGQEVLAGQIRDANTPFLMEAIKGEGYQVAKGPILEDSMEIIAGAFLRTAENGYGIIITTGGIGAESKDQTIEALAHVDPRAERPYILKFQKGQGRHHRDGVRIGVGMLAQTLIICLPGPHDEVRLAWPVLKMGMKATWDKKALAENLAAVLRKKFMDRSAAQHVR